MLSLQQDSPNSGQGQGTLEEAWRMAAAKKYYGWIGHTCCICEPLSVSAHNPGTALDAVRYVHAKLAVQLSCSQQRKQGSGKYMHVVQLTSSDCL